ncbi:hypothetical protein CYLTODRAFT_431244 [Cylindrobasidium torrendii FP15055 ss-10]|uniref:DnaJ homolog 1, mitochondrial n=1 Tax=Cylindrobasidium torrendii FP15055 ss-10 TaxID=1314674 RepID=A0A0D7BAI7_9AGAR|nr:hypothetical protein CYLTODRAFT_431244 [Cylindrobasidium torrendii FP15055 ss-10]
MRLPAQRISSFVINGCVRRSVPCQSRQFSQFRPRCPASFSVASRRTGDKRLLHATSPLGQQKDPYAALGVAKDASQADIKKAYFALARKYHPDTNPDKNAQEKFVEIQGAYDTLKDAKKRAAYDQYGSASQQPGFDPDAFSQAFGGGNPFGGYSGFPGGSPFSAGGGSSGSAFFDNLFGGLNGGRGKSRGDDIETTVNVSFMESCKGTTRKVKTSPVVDCNTCSGSGLKAGAKRTTCTTCGGSGTRTFTIDSGFQMASTCNACKGTGSTVPRGSNCAPCGGMGKVRTSKVVDVNIPPGVDDNMSIQIEGEGDAPVSGRGQTGDLFVRIRVSPSKQFTRQGNNLFHQAKVPFHVALLGGKVQVPTVDGEVAVRLPAGTQQGEEMVLKGRGVPNARMRGAGINGDLYVNFTVTLPRTLSNRQRELLQAYVDDLEGRDSTKSSSETNTDNGMPSFTRQSPFGGWLSSTWQRIRELTGF